MQNVTNNFTKTEQAMLAVLSDGRPHSVEELNACCGPCSRNTARVHLTSIRKKLPPSERILCISLGKAKRYQHVRLLYNPYDGIH